MYVAPGKEHEIGKEYVLTRTAQMYGFTAMIGHADDGAIGGASMVLVRNGEIKVKPSTHPTRVSLEWRDLEYDIADMWTMDDGSNRLDFMSHLDSRRATSMDEFIRDGTATEVLIDPTKVNEPERDKWEAILARWDKEGRQ